MRCTLSWSPFPDRQPEGQALGSLLALSFPMGGAQGAVWCPQGDLLIPGLEDIGHQLVNCLPHQGYFSS